jgi:MFS family permease
MTDLAPKRWYHGLNGYHWLVLAVATMGWMFDTMDQWIYVFAKGPALRELMGPEASDAVVKEYTGYVQSLFIFGWATGGFVFGIIGDKLGRTRTMALTVLMYAGFTGLSAFSQSWVDFAAYRFLTGFGVGGEFAAGASLIAEVFPNHARATALAIMQAFSSLGNVTAAVLNLVVGSDPDWGWRWMFAIGLLPAVLVAVIRLFIKEPESWHHAKAEAEKGNAALGSIRELFTSAVTQHNVIVGMLLAAVGVIGFWGVGTWTPELMREVINPENKPELKQIVERNVSFGGITQNLGAFFGMLFWGFCAHHVGRKPTFVFSLISTAIVIPVTFLFTATLTHALIFFSMIGFCLGGMFAGFAVYFPELFPTRLRATGIGFCYNAARYLAMFSPAFLGWLSGQMEKEYPGEGFRYAGALMASVFPLGLVVLYFAPETKGKPLPE